MKNDFNKKYKNFNHFLLFLFFLMISKVLSTKAQTKSKNSENCGSLCLECVENDVSQCNVCRTGVFRYNNGCCNKCPDGTYTDEEWQVCRDCDSDCPICWGPLSDMCGSKKGVRTQVVLLEHEIKSYFAHKKLNQNEIIEWMFKLNVILKKLTPDHVETPSYINGTDLLSLQDVYNSDKIELDLPIGSFSKNGGVFIPIPSYLTSNFNLINSHWIYVKGMWEGAGWHSEWFPKLPSFIKYQGKKNKIYYENMGYWIFDPIKGIGINSYIITLITHIFRLDMDKNHKD
jgi:hypothetical protein